MVTAGQAGIDSYRGPCGPKALQSPDDSQAGRLLQGRCGHSGIQHLKYGGPCLSVKIAPPLCLEGSDAWSRQKFPLRFGRKSLVGPAPTPLFRTDHANSPASIKRHCSCRGSHRQRRRGLEVTLVKVDLTIARVNQGGSRLKASVVPRPQGGRPFGRTKNPDVRFRRPSDGPAPKGKLVHPWFAGVGIRATTQRASIPICPRASDRCQKSR